MRATTRRPARHYYKACIKCPDCIPGEDKCKNGYEITYYRRSKDNHCGKCLEEIKTWLCCEQRLKKKRGGKSPC